MVEKATPQVEPVPGAEPEAAPETEAEKAAKAEATSEAAKEAEKTAKAATATAEAAKAEAEAAAPERTYSKKEWEQRESAKDQEISDAKNVASQAAMQVQIAQQAQTEATAQAKDKSDIDQGLITEAEANQRQQARQRATAMQPKMEQVGRMMAAQDIGGRYGVNPYDLLSDQTVTSPQLMEAKAKQLAQAKSDTEKKTVSDKIESLEAEVKSLKEGEPLYDSGQQGAGASDLANVPPDELSTLAYSKGEVAKRQQARKK